MGTGGGLVTSSCGIGCAGSDGAGICGVETGRIVGVGGCETQLGGAERFVAARMKSELGTAPVVASEDHTH